MTDLNEVAVRAVALLRGTFLNVRIDFASAPAPLPILAPPADVARLISLLAATGIQSMKGRGTLTIATSRNVVADSFASLCLSVPIGEYGVLAVTDIGRGDSAGDSDLETARAIAGRYGGAVSAHRTPGIGTVVRAFFPSADAGTNPREAESEATPCGTETILLVEDEQAVLFYLGDILRQHGYAVLAASDIRGAVETAATHAGPIHLLITDMALAGTSGAQVQSKVESLRPGIVVLRISGQVERLAGSEDNILEKPFRPPVLLQRIRFLLDSRQPPDAAALVRNLPSRLSAADPVAGDPAKE